MSQPIYYLPSLTRAQLCPQNKLSREILKLRGLNETFRDVTALDVDLTVNEPRTLGPDGQSGLFIAYQTPSGTLPRLIAYKPDEQSWHCCGVNGAFWIGIDKASPPTPEDLARKKQSIGYWLDLIEGINLRIPVIRRPDGTTEMPTDMIFEGDKVVEPIKQAYVEFWDETAKVSDWMLAADGLGFTGPTFSIGEALRLAVRAISLNYRYGKAEQNVLRWVDSVNWGMILGATIDLPKVNAINEAIEQKKSDLETPEAVNTLPGSTGESRDIDPAAETSSWQQTT